MLRELVAQVLASRTAKAQFAVDAWACKGMGIKQHKTIRSGDARHPRDAEAQRRFGFKKSASHLRALARVREWTRGRFRLGDEVPVVVAEVACGLPGCPPLETVVAFWTAGDRRHQFKVFKAVEQVVEDDLPYAWLIESLTSSADGGCC